MLNSVNSVNIVNIVNSVKAAYSAVLPPSLMVSKYFHISQKQNTKTDKTDQSTLTTLWVCDNGKEESCAKWQNHSYKFVKLFIHFILCLLSLIVCNLRAIDVGVACLAQRHSGGRTRAQTYLTPINPPLSYILLALHIAQAYLTHIY